MIVLVLLTLLMQINFKIKCMALYLRLSSKIQSKDVVVDVVARRATDSEVEDLCVVHRGPIVNRKLAGHKRDDSVVNSWLIVEARCCVLHRR